MKDIVMMIIFLLTSIVVTTVAINMAAKESKDYLLNTKEMLLVFFIAGMFSI